MNSVCDWRAAKSRNSSQFSIACSRVMRRGWRCRFRLDWWHQCGILTTRPMKRSLHVPIAPGRMLAAWVCLLAVLLLWTPMLAAAWQAGGMACCAAGMCPVHGHSKTNHSSPQQPAVPEAPMNCGHSGPTSESHSEMTRCSMSCCHENGQSLTAAGIFILPGAVALSKPAIVLAVPRQLAATDFVQSAKPPSPPPRISLLST